MTSLLSGMERVVTGLGQATPSPGGLPPSTATTFSLFDRRSDAHANRLRAVRDARGAGKSALTPLGFGAGRGRELSPAQSLRPGAPPPRAQRAPSTAQRREVAAAAAEQRVSRSGCECQATTSAPTPASTATAVASTAPLMVGPSQRNPPVQRLAPATRKPPSQPAGNTRAKATLSHGGSSASRPLSPRAGGRGPPSAVVVAARRNRAAEAAEARAQGGGGD